MENIKTVAGLHRERMLNEKKNSVPASGNGERQ